MNRRGFLKLLGIGAAAAVAPAIILPERKIWQASRNAPVPSRFYGVRDILAASGGSLFGVDPGYGAKNLVWARWDDESKMLVVDEVDHEAKRVTVFDPANPSNFRRVGSQDLTFERPSKETLRLWREGPAANAKGVLTREAILDIGRTYTAVCRSLPMPEATHSVLWTGITASET